MLRLFHTADWHLGQSFHGYDRHEEHRRFLDWLIGMLETRRPDALLIAGDVFDSVNPPASAQRLYWDFLARARMGSPSLQIVVTAGNHDAAARLESPRDLLEPLQIHVVGLIARSAAGEIDYRRLIVPLKDSLGAVRALAIAVPFLRPTDVPPAPEAADPYLDGIRLLYHNAAAAARTRRDLDFPGAALLALGHCHLLGGLESRDSERRIVIGGAEALRPDTFPTDLAYVALGHLHKPQAHDGGRVQYSGSPIPLSFSEREYEHRVVEIDLDHGRQVTHSSLTAPKTAHLLSLPAENALPIDDLVALLSDHAFDPSLPPEFHPYLEVRVLDTGPDPARRRRIEQALEGKPVRLARIKPESSRNHALSESKDSPAPDWANLGSIDPLELMIDAHREKHQAEPAPELLTAMREILSAPLSESVVG
jgi:exonuclease SbcD